MRGFQRRDDAFRAREKARGVERIPIMSKEGLVILNLSGRGDKDMDTYSRLL